MEQQPMMLIIAGLIGLLLSRALSFKRADFDRRISKGKLGKKLAAALTNDKSTGEDESDVEPVHSAKKE